MMPISGRRGLYARHCRRSQSRGRWEKEGDLVISRAADAASLSFLSSSSGGGGDDIVVACIGGPPAATRLVRYCRKIGGIFFCLARMAEIARDQGRFGGGGGCRR